MTHRKDFCGKKCNQSNQIEENMFPWGKWAQVLLAKHGFPRFLRKNHIDFLRQTIFSDGNLVPIVDFS
jgi:alkyl sulfatase BDS1-like metallo-beta-lactamase superfamily hydrolase